MVPCRSSRTPRASRQSGPWVRLWGEKSSLHTVLIPCGAVPTISQIGPLMTFRHFLLTASVAVATALFATHAAMAARPNVVVILADDQGWGDLSIHGNTNLSTPNIDSLSRDGALFDRFYVCPVCSPTRAEFLTGRYHPRGGVWNVTTGGERLNLDEKTIADTFKSAAMRWGRSASGTTERNILIIPTPGVLTSSTGSVRAIGEIISTPRSSTTAGSCVVADSSATTSPTTHWRSSKPIAPTVSSATCPSIRPTRRCRFRTRFSISSRMRNFVCVMQGPNARTSASRGPRWRCARTSTGTWGACSGVSTS